MNSPSTKKLLNNQRNLLHFEALEPRVLFDASAAVTVETGDLTVQEDQLVNDDVDFTLTFDNVGDQDGYLPYIDFVADSALDITSVTAYGAELTNPDGSGLVPIGMVAADGQLVDISSGVPIDHPIFAATSSTSEGLAGSGTPPVTYDPLLAGQYVYSVTLPFGSFTPGNPAVDVNVTAGLNTADGVLPNQDYTITAQGGFALGQDAADNAGVDPALFGPTDSDSVHPMVFDLVKTAQVREGEDPFVGEMPTGPNHPITYFLEIDIADGETLTNFNVTDLIPPDLAYAGNLIITGPAGTINSEPTVNTDGITGVASGDDTIDITFASITGGPGADIVISYEAFGAYIEADSGAIVVNEISGQETDIKFNDAQATGTWNGQSLTDNASPTSDPDGVIGEAETDYAIEEHSLAVQKGVDFAPGGGDRASTGWNEGDVAEYTLDFQISDYFAFDTVTIQDDMGDGIEFLPALDAGSTWANSGDFNTDVLEMRPELTFTMHSGVGGTVTVLFDEANFDATENADGTTTVNYNVYQQLVDSGFIVDGDPLVGGMIPEIGIDPATMGSATFNSGVATVGTIRYRALVRDEYQSLFTSGEPNINQGDRLENDATITGRNLDVEDFNPLQDVTDDSSAAIEIVSGEVQKELFSATRNGVQVLVEDLDSGLEVMPGDVITWRITYDLPSTEFENLILRDYLPLPVFDEASIDTSQIYAYGDPGYLTAGRISFGTNDTFFGQNGPGATGDGGINDMAGYAAPNTPTISLIPEDNAFEIDFGDYIIPEALDPVRTTIELYVSTVIQDGVYADGLLFTNQVGASENNSNETLIASNEIAMIELTVPDIRITKGVIATENPNSGTFTDTVGPGTATYSQPGSDPAWTGAITSADLVNTPIDSNNVGLDAADVVTFGLAVENYGASDEGAFDVTISDTVPDGFVFPASAADAAFNLQVRDGNGTPLAYTVTDFDSVGRTFEIQLTDTLNQGALTEYDPDTGTNLVIVTYDLVLESDVDPAEVLTNVATVENYSYEEGGLNYAEPEDTDDATVTVLRPVVDKTIIDTSHDDADNLDGNAEVTIGEIVTYSVTISIPEGHMENSRILDTLPPGMAFIGLDSVSFGGALSTSVGAGDFTDVEGVYNASLNVLELGVGGVAGLGTITNSDTDNTVAEQITFTYRAVVLNDAANQSGLLRTNDAEMRWTVNSVEQVQDDSKNVLVVEPDVTVDKTVVGGTTDVQGADEIIYEIVVANNNSGPNVSEAYDIELLDLLPGDVSYVAASVTFVSGVAPNAGTLQFDGAQGTEGAIVGQWDRLGVGEQAVIRVTVRIDDGLATDTVITNTAEVEFSSLPGDPGDAGYNGYDGTTATGPNVNPANSVLDDAIERTGDSADQGGAVNDYNDDDPAVVTVVNPVGIRKAIIDTAEAHTAFDNSASGSVQGAIGEVIRYEVRVQIPQAANSQLQLVDTMSPNLIWIDSALNNLQISLEGFNLDGSTLVADADIGAANGTTIALDPTRAAYSAATNAVTFDFGDITNLETDGGPEFLVISYNAIVGNDIDALDGDGTTGRGDILVNSVQLFEGGDSIGSNLSIPVEIVEPELDIQKSDNGVATADAGDVITYTLNVTAADDGSDTHTTAFDIAVGDVLPDELDLLTGTLSITGLPAGSSIVSQGEDLGADSISVIIDRLDPGESFQIEFQARVRDTGVDIIHSDETVTNTATLAYSSLPGDGTDDGVGENTTGNESGNPDDEDGERTYTDSDTDNFTTPTPTLEKVLGNPADTTFTIGESVEYVITLEVPEGRVGDPNAFILDTIDPGFRYLPGTLQVNVGTGITYGTAGTLNETNGDFFTHTDPGNTASAESLRFDFGLIDFNNNAAGNGVNTTGTIEIRYELQVENIVANQEGDLLNNVADFFYTDDDGVTQNTVDDSTGDVDTIITIVEPQVNVAKAITNITAPEAGGIVSYAITLTHPGGVGNPLFNVPAFDVSVEDVMPAGVDIQTGTFTATLNSASDVSSFFLVTANGFTDDGLGSIDMQPGDVIVITYDALITPAVQDGVSLVNEVDVEWTSLDGGDLTDGIDSADTGERTGDGDPDAVVDPTNPNDYENEDTAEFDVEFTNTFAFTKSIVSTSAAQTGIAAGTDPLITDLTIGETVTYALTATVGRGTVDGVRITDQLDLAAGYLDITNVSFTAGAQLSGVGLVGATPTISDTNFDGYNDAIEYDFGTLVNDPADSTGAADDQQIIVYITATVVNDIENQGGDIITNTGNFYYFDDPTGSGVQSEQRLNDDVDVELVEPDLNVSKTITSVPASPDAGDAVSYQIVVGNTSDTDAFDVSFQDLLPAQMDLELATFTATLTSTSGDVSSFFIVTADDIRHAGTGFNLAAGDSITITYDTTILSTVTDGAFLTNEVDIEWTTLDDDDPTSGDPTQERGGDGDPDNTVDPANPNDYEDEDEQTVTANLTPVYGFTKSILQTDQAHTGITDGTDVNIEDLVVGETVTYVLIAQIGEGTTPGVQITDALDLSNGLLDIRNVRVTGGSNLTSDVAPSFSLIPAGITDSNLDTYFDTVFVNFGNVVNDASGLNLEDGQIRIEIDAVVVNVLENQGGDVINNSATLRYLEDLDGDGDADDESTIVDDVDVEIVEPAVFAAKSVTSVTLNLDAQDIVTYQIVVSNTTNIDAFDVTFIDDLPAKLLYDSNFTATLWSGGGTSDVSSFFQVAGDNSSIAHAGNGFFLGQNDSITITYDARITDEILDGEQLTNLVDVEWTSTPGDNDDERGGDGDPNNSAPSTNPNDYESEDDATIEANLTGYNFDKSIFTTSMNHTDASGGTDVNIEDLVVGETVTYVLTASFAEGTTTGVYIEDAIQIANGILDVRNVTYTLGSNLSGSATPVIDDVNVDSFNEHVLLDFGTVVNSGANGVDPTADQILVYIEAIVENVIENQEGDVIQNDAEFRFLEDSNDDNIINGSDTPTVLADDEVVEILEPNLSVTKAVSNERPKLNEVITYTLTITNNVGPSATDAFDIAISDFMDPAMTLDPSSIILSVVGTPANPSSIISNNSTGNSFDLVIDVLEEGESIRIIYDVTVSSDPADFMTVFPNVANLAYTSTPGDNPDERGGDPDPNDPNDPNDYNDTDDESVEVHQPDLRIEKVDDEQRIFPGQLFDYTMTVTNQGRATALGVTITDDISNYLVEGFQFVSGTNATISGGVVTFALPDMAVDDVQVVTLTLRAPRVIPAGLEEIVNVAQANHIDIEPTPEDNEDDEPTPIIAVPDLTVVKDDGLTYATVGDEVTYAITFDNVGNQVASGVVIKDTLPPGVRFISATNGGRVAGGSVVWNIDELRPRDGGTFYVTVELLTDGVKINNVTIEDDGAGGPDPTPGNNKDQDKTISEPGLQFDLNQNFLSGHGNTSSILDSFNGFRGNDLRPEPLFDRSAHQPVMYATYMNSGLAQPGSTITLEVYDQMGRLIADTSVVADTGGNWLATFPMADVERIPSRVVIKQTWASTAHESQRGYNFRTYFGPAFTTGTYYTEELSIWNVTEKRAATEVIDLYESSKMILALDWNGSTYEFAARGALQSSSGN